MTLTLLAQNALVDRAVIDAFHLFLVPAWRDVTLLRHSSLSFLRLSDGKCLKLGLGNGRYLDFFNPALQRGVHCRHRVPERLLSLVESFSLLPSSQHLPLIFYVGRLALA